MYRKFSLKIRLQRFSGNLNFRQTFSKIRFFFSQTEMFVCSKFTEYAEYIWSESCGESPRSNLRIGWKLAFRRLLRYFNNPRNEAGPELFGRAPAASS